MEELKQKVMELSIAELQHLFFHCQKNRDDVLMFISFTKEFFKMDGDNFKEFKNLVLYGDCKVELSELLKQAIGDTLKEEANVDKED